MAKYPREKLIEKIIERVDKGELPLKIKKIAVFGSLLTKQEVIGDADLFFTNEEVSKIGKEWLKQIENNQKYLIGLPQDIRI